MNLQKLYSYTRQAIDDYAMIQDGDRIAVGLSGGKDSLTLLYALHGLKSFYPDTFTIQAVTVDLGLGHFDLTAVAALCSKLQLPHTIVKTNIGEILFEARKEKNPCSLCAKMRKGAFNHKVLELGCNKIAYAHHKDDLIETMLMSLLHEGRFYAFPPITYLEKTGLTLIRPLIYTPEAQIKSFVSRHQLPVCKSPCPIDGRTKRQYAKELVKQLADQTPGAKESLYSAIINGGISDWPPKTERYERYGKRTSLS